MQLDLRADRFVEVEIGDAKVTAKILPSSRLVVLAKKHTKSVFKRGAMTEDFDAKGFSRDLWGETISAWSGFSDMAGNEIPCTAENAFQLVDRHPEIGEKIREAIDAAKSALLEFDKADSKN